MGFHIIKIHSRRRNPGLVRVAHVLIPFEKDSVKFGEAETLARAEEVYRKAKDGADFAMLAKEYSSDAGSVKREGSCQPLVSARWWSHSKWLLSL